jgi:tryptophanase
MDEYFRGCNRKPDDYASVGFTLELIKDYGIRAVESGPFGWEWDPKSPEERAKIPNLVRFAVPRHVLADEHINYTVAAIKKLHNRRHTIPNVIITRGKNMRLRHFSCGMKPVPVNPTITGTYIEEITRQLEHLSAAIGQDTAIKGELIQALKLVAGEWGQVLVPKEADMSGRSWLSSLSNDCSPVEYSVAIAQSTGETELRFSVEAQPAENSLARLREKALRLNEDINTQYGATVSFDRFNRICDLFMPMQPDAGTKLMAWHSCAVSKTGPQWKIYLNPRALGEDASLSVVSAAFKRLDMPDSWSLVEGIMSSNDSVIYISLDLSSDLAEARVKVYITHTSASAAEVAHKHHAICPRRRFL